MGEFLNKKIILSFVTAIFFLLNSIGPMPDTYAADLALPVPGTLLKVSPHFRPPLIQGLKIDARNPFHFQFIMEEGQDSVRDEETMRSLRYFLTALTVPENDIWVNLSPRENKRIIPSVLSNTEMGVDLLGQDYLLKQLAASLLYPEGAEGKEFWRHIYARAVQLLGTTNVPLNVVNKVWITPGEIVVQEKGNMAIINKATLDVMVESDYLAMKAGVANSAEAANKNQSLMNDVYRKIVIPELTMEVNQGTYFSRVRQIYHTLILAAWYKRHFHQGAVASSYVDLRKTDGVSVEDRSRFGKIYSMYLKAYKKGVFNYIREEADPEGIVIPRKYFSGGFDIGPQLERRFHSIQLEKGELPFYAGKLREVDVRFDSAQSAEEYIVNKEKKENQKEMGNKGRNLEENEEILKGHIPPFEILSSRLYDDFHAGNIDLKEVARVVREKFAYILDHEGTLVVRPSSAINMPGILPTAKKVSTIDDIVQAILGIYQGWENPEAQRYLETKEAEESFDTMIKMNIYTSKEEAKRTPPAIVVQKEVFGDMNEQSGSGVMISRNTKTGEFLLSGSYGVKLPPEEIRNGAQGIELERVGPDMNDKFPSFLTQDNKGIYEILKEMADKLERHYGYPVEVEFIIEDGKLFVVQINEQDIREAVQLAVATNMADEGKISRTSIAFPHLNGNRHIGQVKANANFKIIAQGLGLSVGAAEGYLAFSVEKIKQLRRQGHQVIYVSKENNDQDLFQLLVSNEIDGFITLYGDYHMHNARIARGGGAIPGISLANQDVQIIDGNERLLAIGGQKLKEGERVVINAIEEDAPHGGDIIHQGQLILPLQAEPVVESTGQVSVGHLYFNTMALQLKIMRQYKGTDYKVLTATHALLKAYSQRNIVKGLEGNKLEGATNAIHMLLSGIVTRSMFTNADPNGGEIFDTLGEDPIFEKVSEKEIRLKQNIVGVLRRPAEIAGSNFDEVWSFLQVPLFRDRNKTREKDGSREDVFRPIAQGFGDKFPFPDIHTVDDIPKAVALMDQFVSRYSQIFPERLDYLNYSHTDPIVVPFEGDVPLEFSIIPNIHEINWQYENPQLWAYVQGIDVGVNLVKGLSKKYVIQAELMPDPMSPEKIRVIGKLSVQKLPEVEEEGDTYVKVGLFRGPSNMLTWHLGHDYHVQIKSFDEYMRHKIDQVLQKGRLRLSGNGFTVAQVREYLSNPKVSMQLGEMRSVLTDQENVMWSDGGYLWRSLKQSGAYTLDGSRASDLNPSKFWAKESGFLVGAIRQLFPGINISNLEKKNTEAPSALQGHNLPTLYVETYSSYVVFDKDAVEKLSEAIAAFSQTHDLSNALINDEREVKLDLEVVILHMFAERFGKSQLVGGLTDSAQVGGIDLNLAGRKIGSDLGGKEFSAWTKGSFNRIKGLVPVIVRQRNISTVLEFVQSGELQ
jgi:hypothetical protein